VSRSKACERLGISDSTFWRRWHSIFTETRQEEDQVEGRELKQKRKLFAGVDRGVYEDELDLAVEKGGKHAARLAVLNYRGLMGRK